MTQVDIPAHVLEQFRQGIQLDTTVLDDVRAAIVELSDHVQFRTQALGDATINLHTGFAALQQQVETLREALQIQSRVVEKTIAGQEDDLQSLRRFILDEQGKHNGTVQRLDANVQREALLEAVEFFGRKVRGTENAFGRETKNCGGTGAQVGSRYRKDRSEHQSVAW